MSAGRDILNARLAQLHAENAVYLDALATIAKADPEAVGHGTTVERALDMANELHRDLWSEDEARPIAGAIVILQLSGGGFEVLKDGRTTGPLSFDECLGQVAVLTGPGRLFAMDTPAGWRAKREARAERQALVAAGDPDALALAHDEHQHANEKELPF